MSSTHAPTARKAAAVAATVGSVTLAWALMGAPSAQADQAAGEDGGPDGEQATGAERDGDAVLEAEAVVDIPGEAAPAVAPAGQDGQAEQDEDNGEAAEDAPAAPEAGGEGADAQSDAAPAQPDGTQDGAPSPEAPQTPEAPAPEAALPPETAPTGAAVLSYDGSAEAVEAGEGRAVAAVSEAAVGAWVSPDGSSVTLTASGGMYAEAWNVAFRVTGGSLPGERWLQAERQQDGSWTAAVPASSTGSGALVATPFAQVGSSPAQAGSDVELRVPGAAATLSLAYDEAAGAIRVRAADVSCPSGVTFVSVGLSGPDGATRWYRLGQQADGSWEADADPADFGWRSGTYLMDASICDAAWKGVPVGTKSAEVSFGSAAVEAALSADRSDVELSASGGRLAAAWNVAFEVQGTRGVAWVAAARGEDGAWKASLPASGVGSGKASVRVWACVGSSPAAPFGSSSVEVPAATGEAGLAYDASSGRLVVSASGVTCPSGVTFVSVGVTSPAGAVKWYRLAQQPDGGWSASVDPDDFGWQAGAYSLDASICDAAWQGVPLGASRADVAFDGESLAAEAADGGATLAVATSAEGRYARAWGVSFEITGRAGTTWVPAARMADGTWSYAGAASQWGGGFITVSAYANIGTSSVRLGSARVNCSSEEPAVSATVQPSEDSVLLTAAGGVFGRAENVAFAVRNVTGEDGTHWFQAERQADGSWTAQIDAALDGVGTCIVEGWATSGGSTSVRASTRYTYRVAPAYVSQIDLGGGDYDVSLGMAGLKVRRIQHALGIGDSTYPRYLEGTASAVSAFQSRVGLPATGVVDKQTWLALGLDEGEWTTLGAYASPVEVSAGASRSERVEAMIGRAEEYLGDPYVWDAAGAPKQGVDCAGLVIQALYAAGVDLGIINPVTHSATAWGDHDASNLYYYGGMERVSADNRARGDLVYYDYGTGSINHVAIYLGQDRVIEALPYNVRTSSLFRTGSMWFTRPIA